MNGAMNWSFEWIRSLTISWILFYVPALLLVSFVENKVSARMQARVGHHRVGLDGFLQPLADFFKAIKKERNYKYAWAEASWFFAFVVMHLSLIWAAPAYLGTSAEDNEIALVLPLTGLCLPGVVVILRSLWSGTWEGCKFGFQNAVLITAHLFLFLVVYGSLSVVMRGNGFNLLAEGGGIFPWSWPVFAQPLLIPQFAVGCFANAVFYHRGLNPFWQDENSRVTGIDQVLLRLVRSCGYLTWILFSVFGFLGGAADSRLGLAGVALILPKVILIATLTHVVVSVVSRMRLDQLTGLCWRWVAPISVAVLLLIRLRSTS